MYRRLNKGLIVLAKGLQAPSARSPRYWVIAEALRHRIQDGKLPPHSQLPAETELAEEFGVARMTLRRALNELVEAGLLYRVHGRGTFVADGTIQQDLNRLTSFSEEMAAQGLSAESKVLSMETIEPPRDVASRLGLTAGEQVHKLMRLRQVDGHPVGLQVSFLPVRLLPGFKPEILVGGSIYRTIEERYKLVIGRGEQVIQAVAPSATEVRLLGIAPHVPVLKIARTTYLQDGRPVEFAVAWYRGDRYSYRVLLRR